MKNLIIKNYKTLHHVQSNSLCITKILRCAQNDKLFSSKRFFNILFSLIIFLTFASTACLDAQVYKNEDIEICNSKFQLAVDEELSAKPINEVIVEIKAISDLSGTEEAQLINYLKATGLEVGLLINFGSKSLEHKRFVYTM